MSKTHFKKRGNLRFGCCNNFLFAAGTIAIAGGLLFPQSTRIFDVVLIFSIFLTAAVLMITFSAKQIPELSGFPLLVVAATTIRMGLNVVCSKFIFSDGDAGTIVNFLGNMVVKNNIMFSILVFSVLMIIIFVAICKCVSGIGRSVSEFTTDIVPIRQININSDLNSGIITNEQAIELRNKINNESGFFLAMAGTGRFMLCAAVIELIITTINIFGGVAAGLIGETTTGVSIRTYASSAIGAAMIMQVSALIIVTASGYLVGKIAVKDEISEQESIKRIKIIANDVSSSFSRKPQYNKADEIKLPVLSPWDSAVRRPLRDLRRTNIDALAKADAETTEWFDGATEAGWEEDSNLWDSNEIKESNCYGIIAELIKNKLNPTAKSILMAAESAKKLPVTVPVNIGMRLAQKGQRCLLVDLDWQRDAISKVFEAAGKDKRQAIETCINNLWVLSAGNFSKRTNIKDVIAGIESQYDHLIVYAPNISTAVDREKIADCVDAAMLFGSNEDDSESVISDFGKFLNSYGCDIIEPASIFEKIEQLIKSTC